MIFKEGSYKLLGLTLSVDKEALEISPYVARMDIFESILAPTIIAEIIVSDSTGLFSATSLTEEEVCVSFSTYDDTAPLHYRFKVVEVSPVLRAKNDDSISYVLTCMSEELVKSTNLKKPFVRQNIEAEKVVIHMLEKELDTKKDISVEKTQGLHTISSKESPFDIIENARNAAISSEFKGSAFVFFENQFGFHFKSIENLIKNGLNRIGDKFFTHTPLAGVDPNGNTWRNIIGLKVIQNSNQNVAMAVGGYRNKVKRFNIVTGKIELFENDAGNMEFVSLNEGSITVSPDVLQEKEGDVGGNIMNLYYEEQEKNFLAEKLNNLPYYLSHFLSVICHITIYGDTTITVGDVITCKIPEMSGITHKSGQPDDPILSGNYLVCKLRHILTFGETPKYFQSLEIVKDGIGGKLPNPTGVEMK